LFQDWERIEELQSNVDQFVGTSLMVVDGFLAAGGLVDGGDPLSIPSSSLPRTAPFVGDGALLCQRTFDVLDERFSSGVSVTETLTAVPLNF
jgi:hypothetical protein